MFGWFKRKQDPQVVMGVLLDNASTALAEGKMFTIRLKNVNKTFKHTVEVHFHQGDEACKGWSQVAANADIRIIQDSRERMCQHIEILGYMISDLIYHPKLNNIIPESLAPLHLPDFPLRYVFFSGNTLVYITFGEQS